MSENKKIKKLNDARGYARTISLAALGMALFWFIVYAILGIFSSNSPFSEAEKIVYALIVLVPTALAAFLSWFRYWIIRDALSDDDQKD